jgi:hypothetical protein
MEKLDSRLRGFHAATEVPTISVHHIYDAGHRDTVLPFSEFSMFASRTENADFAVSLSMVA